VISRVRLGPAAVGLERDAVRHPFLAEAVGEPGPVAFRTAREGVVEAVRALEHRARPDEAVAREVDGADAGLRRPAGVQALGPRALREVLDDAARHRADDA